MEKDKPETFLSEKQKRYLPLKRTIDLVVSSTLIVVFCPIWIALALAIKLDSKGPILFKQKRVGKDKELFEIWKFRTMRIDTPKDMPTHMLNDPEQYITKVGKFLRKTSLDELPQIFNIFMGQMSLIGPRPALWNQYDLIEERDKYGANSITPGLTGWAQINGRDELEIPVKAKLDGDYVRKMGLRMDLKCFLATIGSIITSDGVVEGGTGEMRRADINKKPVSPKKIKKKVILGGIVLAFVQVIAAGVFALCLYHKKKKQLAKNQENSESKKKGLVGKMIAFAITVEGFATVYTNIKRRIRLSDKFVEDEREENHNDVREESQRKPKRILITGANSYIGMSVEEWLRKEMEQYHVDTLDMLEDSWREYDFSSYDVVYHVAGIAHADVGSVTEEEKKLYYKVNTELAVEVAKKAKAEGVKQFIFMSSMIVYSGCNEKIITKDTIPKALNFYGDSKLQADKQIRELADEDFLVVVLRPPMIYGKGSKGNYPKLAKFASRLPVFPVVKNKRSMLHIDNLCEFVKLMIDNEESGVFFPQNAEYTNTSDMVQMIADVKGHRIIMIPGMSLPLKLVEKLPGKIGGMSKKAFGDSAYEMSMSEYKIDYRVNSLRESIEKTENSED